MKLKTEYNYETSQMETKYFLRKDQYEAMQNIGEGRFKGNVDVDENGYIIKYDLGASWIFDIPKLKIIHPDIGKLEKLEYLGLSNHEIHEIPGNISNLKSLKELDLSHNKLESLPYEIMKLKALEELKLACNNFSEFPEIICDLKNLRDLNLYANKIKNLPKGIYRLELLNGLHLSANEIEEVPSSIQRLGYLRQIDLYKNPLNIKSIKLLRKMKKRKIPQSLRCSWPDLVDPKILI